LAGLDLSEATQLRDVVFQCTTPNVEWINKALHTARSGNLQRISLELSRRRHVAIGAAVWETVNQEWADLDNLLVEFWALRSIRPKVIYELGKGEEEEERRDRVARLLPELTAWSTTHAE